MSNAKVTGSLVVSAAAGVGVIILISGAIVAAAPLVPGFILAVFVVAEHGYEARVWWEVPVSIDLTLKLVPLY